MNALPKMPAVSKGTGIRIGHLAAAAVYACLAIFAGVALHLGALTTAIVVLLPIAGMIVLVLGSRGSSTGSEREFETTGATSRAEYSVPVAPDAVKEIIKNNVRDSRRFNLLSEDPTTLLIKARASTFTWGEEIVVSLQGADGGTRINAECRHKQRTAIVDFGQSKRDLQTVLQGLDRTQG